MRALLAGAAFMLALALPSQAAELRSRARTWPAQDLESVRLGVKVGEVRVEGTETDRVSAVVTVKCNNASTKRCMERSEKIRLDARTVGRSLRLDLRGVPKRFSSGLDVGVDLSVPRRLSLGLEVGVGEIEVRDLGGDLDMKVGVGEITVEAREGEIGRVRANVGVGDASLRARGGRVHGEGFLGRDLRWTGTGEREVHVDVGVGEVTIRLD
jgi:hypothetical protein